MLIARFDSKASLEAALVTVIVYVVVLRPLWEVTTTLMVFVPTFNETGADACPEVVAVPFTVMVSSACAAVGVTDILLMPLPTVAV